MVRLNTKLDPSKTGREAETLEHNLRKLIVGQNEAIDRSSTFTRCISLG